MPRGRLTILAMLGCLGCSDDPAVGAASPVTWLLAERVEPAEREDPRVLFLGPEELLACDEIVGSLRIVEVEATEVGVERMLVFGRPENAHFTIDGPFEPGSVNSLELSGVFWRPAWITVHAVRDGKVVLSTKRMNIPAEVRAQAVRVELRELEREGAIDGLAVHFSSDRASFGLASAELLRRDRIDSLPARDGIGVEIGTETRPAIGISNRRPAAVPLAGHTGRRLTFDYGVPPRLNTYAGPVRLVVTLESGSSSELVPTDESSPGAWRTVQLTLPPGRAPDARLRIALDAGTEEEVVAAVGNFMFVEPQEHPQAVLLVTSDTHRADHLGCAAEGVSIETPFLDELAARGLRYSDCWSLSNVTNPSHISIHSGIHPRDTKIVNNHTPLTRAADTLADRFREAGFQTYAAVSAPHLGDELCGLGQGFQRYDAPADVRSASETIDRALRWLDGAPATPLFLWVHLFDAHGPYEPPAPFSGRYYPEHADRYDPSRPALGEFEAPRWDTDLRDPEWPRAEYRAEISYLDSELERLFEHERLAQAISVVTADHGECLGEGGVFFRHDGLSRSTLAVPLILVGPDVPAGQVVDSGVHLGDLSRTVLDLAGLPSTPFPGRSLLSPGRDEPRFALQAHGVAASVRSGRWFLVLELDEQPQPFLRAEVHEVHLFDLSEDPRCEVDLAELEFERASELRALLVRWLSEARAGDMGAVGHTVEADTLEMLQELGYSDGAQVGPDRVWIDPECSCDWCRRYSNG